jgi:hypothetical protein
MSFYDVLSPRDSFLKAKGAVMKALEIDPGLTEAHTSRLHSGVLSTFGSAPTSTGRRPKANFAELSS